MPHKLLLHKLKYQYGFNNKLINWFTSYLGHRKQRVVLNNVYSDWLPVTSGMLQGSILGPLMFLLYINGMPSVSSLCTTALFADDVKCFKEIKSQTDSVILQNHLDMLYNWSTNWEMSFNVHK